jgi:hypothetical protein
LPFTEYGIIFAVFLGSFTATKVIKYRDSKELQYIPISKGEHQMKKLVIFSVLIATVLFGCKSQQKATGYTYDDVYSTRSDNAKIAAKPKIQNEDLSGTHPVALADSSSATPSAAAVSNEDYSNNSYAARIKRFNGKNSGLNYNNEYYTGTDSTSGGSSPDVNIYFGNSWGSSFWGPSYSFGLGFGWGDCDFCYPYSWYYPYYWGYPYYSYYPYSYGYWDYPYWGGYGHGHHHGDWGWNNGNFRDNYYGQRRTLTTPDGGRNSRTNTSTTKSESGQVKNTRTTDPGIIKRSNDQTRSGRTDVNRVAPDKQRYVYTRSRTQENTRIVRNNDNTKTQSVRNYAQRKEVTPRYTRPGNQQQANRSDAQTYSSPAYRQPKSSQEYINPRPQQGRPTGVNNNSNRNGNYNNPNPSGRRYSQPSNTGGNSRTFSNPSRSYSTPSRSYSSPSRSSGSSYSAPSRSSSSPSHSGGNSGSSSGSGSSGGSSGGRRR